MIDTKLYLYNTLAREKQEFVPIEPGKVKMYSCGPTVYNFFHIGNARPFILFDTLRRYLEYKGFSVDFVQNFTDIDDKMINKANELGITVKELADQYINEYFIDAKGLGIRQATVHPRATEHIEAIIKLVESLVEGGYAYNVDGDVYYRTKKFGEYGKLSHQPLEDLESGARIDVNDDKEDPMDFALWKKQKPGEPAWESPWGMGRPGWHIECSAMANTYLGKTIDIHSGGQDLIFPHHENEIAQSEAANCCQFANYWVHNGYINVDNRKMSKSLGNFFTVRDVAKEFDYEVIRFFMLSAHYRSPINFSKDLMEAAASALERIYTCIASMNFFMESAEEKSMSQEEEAFSKALDEYKEKFIHAMDDDLNTADAISVIFEIVADANKMITAQSGTSKQLIQKVVSMIGELGGVLGLLERKEEVTPAEVEELLDLRKEARETKNWAESDRIRDLLKDMGYAVKDTPQGQQLTKL
ncbi:MAG: cysteine--tRNA ligase [Clostridia bacterium]|nr:cysteine--tRNA ligase [Clostridia bacterium]